MPELRNEPSLRDVKNLPFCYLCGNGFNGKAGQEPGSRSAEKHLRVQGPRVALDPSDTSRNCNKAQSGYNEVAGQLFATIHGKYPEPDRVRLDVRVAEGGVARNSWRVGFWCQPSQGHRA